MENLNETEPKAEPAQGLRELLVAAFRLRYPKADALVGILKIAGYEVSIVRPRK